MNQSHVAVGVVVAGVATMTAMAVVSPAIGEEPKIIGVAAVGMAVTGEPMIRSVVCRGAQPGLSVERFTRPGVIETVARYEPRYPFEESTEFPAENTTANWRAVRGGFRVAEQPAGELVVGATGDPTEGWFTGATRVTAAAWLELEPGQWLATDWTPEGPVNRVFSAGELHEFACNN